MILLSSSKWLWHASTLSLPSLDLKCHTSTYVDCKYLLLHLNALIQLLILWCFGVISLFIYIRSANCSPLIKPASEPVFMWPVMQAQFYTSKVLQKLQKKKKHRIIQNKESTKPKTLAKGYIIKKNVCFNLSLFPLDNVELNHIYSSIFHYR